MDKFVNLDIRLKIRFNQETGEYTIDSQHVEVAGDEPRPEDMTLQHRINYSEKKYGALTLGGRTGIGKRLLPGDEVSIYIEGEPVGTFKVHGSIKGRIDGLKVPYMVYGIDEGDLLGIRYDFKKRLLEIENISKSRFKED